MVKLSSFYLTTQWQIMASKEIYYKNQSFTISYQIVNPSQTPSILILHGWGSNKEIMKNSFGQTLSEYKHIYIDMPGFGKSSNPMILQTSDYTAIIKLFLETLNVNIKIAMGHSFGGKVATLLDTPYLVLLSSSGVLVPKAFIVRCKIALFKMLKPLKLDKFQQLFVSSDAKGMSQEMYETFKNVVNEDFEENFIKSKSESLLFWGKEDTATPLYSGKRIAQLIKKSHFYPLDGDHFFFVKHNAFIAQTIINICKESN